MEYEPTERPPFGKTVRIAGQLSILVMVRLSLLTILTAQLAEQTNTKTVHMIAMSLGICGLIMLLFTRQTGLFTTKNLYIVAINVASIPFCILAMTNGGPAALAALVTVSGLFQILIGTQLSHLRRLIAPTVSGTLLILACISLAPILYRSLTHTQHGDSPLPALVCMATTAAVIFLVQKLGPPSWKIWAGPLGIVIGMIASMTLGIYDYQVIRDAAWVGLPVGNTWEWNENVSMTFFTLLPSFLILSFMNLGRTNNLSILTQFVSWRELHSVDFRDVQRTNSCIGVGTILSGIIGSMPIAVSPLGPAFIKKSKCASLRVGTIHGVMLIMSAFLPKVSMAIIAIPRQVITVYLLFALTPLLIIAVRIYRRTIHGIWNYISVMIPVIVGLCIESDMIKLSDNTFVQVFTANGLTAGSIVVAAIAIINNLSAHRRHLDVELNTDSVARLHKLMAELATEKQWDTITKHRLEVVTEEAILTLIEQDQSLREQPHDTLTDHHNTSSNSTKKNDCMNSEDINMPDKNETAYTRHEHQDTNDTRPTDKRRLHVVVTVNHPTAVLEFISAPSKAENLENRLAILREHDEDISEITIEHDMSLRLLRHYSKSVTHRQYQEAEIISTVVEVSTES